MAPTPQEHVNGDRDATLGGACVVISGISGLYPSAHSVKELSDILYDKKNPINDNDMRWDYNHPELCNKTGKVPGLDRFDAQFFKVHWRQGKNMDLMCRKILEQTFNAIYDAGLSPHQLSGKKIGVYIGSCFSETEKAWFYVTTTRTGFGITGFEEGKRADDPPDVKWLSSLMDICNNKGSNCCCFWRLSPHQLSGKKIGVYIGSCFSETEKAWFYVTTTRTGFGITGCNKAMFANRISYWLNIKGPSMAIDQACCSSLAALEQAHRAIQKGECEAAIVGGAHLSLHPQSSVHYARIMKMSSDGKTRSFDQNSEGCAKSEAVNILFLQKAKDALRIYAEVVHVKSQYNSLLKGDIGPKYGFYRDPTKITDFLETFYKEANVPPQSIEYVEAFGSAVPEVDKLELEAIDKVLCVDRSVSLPVGSVMSNIGYAEAASGISAITKVLLGYHCGEIAGNLHFTTPRQDISPLREGRMHVVDDHKPFRRTYAAVNAMSVTGVNAHVLLKGHYKPKDLNRYKSSIPYLVTISGRQESAVNRIFSDLKSRLIDPEEIALLHKIHEITISGHMSRGFAILDTKDNETVSLCENMGYYDDSRRPLWFVYSGMGSQWPGMGTQLMRIPVFAAAIERCRRVLDPKGIDLVNVITSTDKTIFDNILHSFVGIAAVQIGLTDVLSELGIVPDNIIGHSVGELGCAYADGCLTAEEMILSAYSRGLVSLQTPFIRGSMVAVGLGYEQIKNMCPAEIEVACHNGPESCTISGPAEAMREFVAQLTAKGIFAREVPCSNIAYHSQYIAGAGPGLLNYLQEVIKMPRRRSDRWFSTSVPQEKWQEQSAQYSSAEYHTNNLLSPVLFEETSLLIPSNAVLVEIAPHGLLQAILKRSLPESCQHIPLTRRGHPDNSYLVLEAVGKLFMEGLNPKIHQLYPKVEFPVSTGTPMLSHLIEWDHRELWPVPLYATANRGVAAVWNNVISLHDEEHTYIRGNIIRNKTLYPFTGALVAVWDTLAMSVGVAKKQLSVKFRDVHFYSQPTLHDWKRLKLSVQLHRGTGYFEVTERESIVALGYILQVTISEKMDETTFTNVKLCNNKLSSEDIYELLRIRDHRYRDQFRSIHSADASLFEATLQWKNNWVTLIDGLLQLHVLHRPHDHVSQLTMIKSLKIDVNKHDQEKIYIDGDSFLKTNISNDVHFTRCGGILIEQAVFTDLLYKQDGEVKFGAFGISPFKHIDMVRSTTVLDTDSHKGQMLTSSLHGDLDSLKWVQNGDLSGEGIDVKVHFAGINAVDVRVAEGVYPVPKECEGYGMDFSGVTDSGQRVMGLVRGGAVRSRLLVHPSLLWPVPDHWSLEEAATVPLAYLQAMFCLTHPLTDKFGGFDSSEGVSVLIQGGAGAAGQAAISVALALGYKVFTTVSSVSKKRFLRRLYPQLKDECIGFSRDESFSHVVLNETKGNGTTVVITCAKGALKNESLKCCASSGVTFDVVQVPSQEKYSLPMALLARERSYLAVDIPSLLDDPSSKFVKSLHSAITQGIAKGVVRPLTRVCFPPNEAPDAFRLVADCGHRGRVLLQLGGSQTLMQPRLSCSKSGYQIVVCDKDTVATQFADRLISRGARHLHLVYNEVPGYMNYKKRSWETLGVHVEVTSQQLFSVGCAKNIFNEVSDGASVEGVYVIATDADSSNAQEYNDLLRNLDATSRTLCPDLKYFAVVSSVADVGQATCDSRRTDKLPATLLYITRSSNITSQGESEGFLSGRNAVDAIETALLNKSSALVARPCSRPRLPLLQRLASVTGLKLSTDASDDTCLEDLATDYTNVAAASALLRDDYDISLSDEQILKLSVARLREIDETSTEMEYENVKGLKVFYSLVDSDELVATTDLILLPTLANNMAVRDDEFDVKQKFLYVIPGMEGHHGRFRIICERLKISALVLQPGLDRPHETIEELAERYAKVIVEKTKVKDDFYLLGYETGVAVALETAAILEKLGFTGTVFCVGFLPDELKTFIGEQLSEYKSEDQLQDAVLRHMCSLMTKGNDSEVVERTLSKFSSWEEKKEACLRTLLGQVSHSAQYASALVESAYARILLAREYRSQLHPLRSRLVLLRPLAPGVSPESGSRYSLQPLLQYQLSAPMAHALVDLRCTSIVNKHLAPEIIEEYEKKNLCDTYLLNSDTFISL